MRVRRSSTGWMARSPAGGSRAAWCWAVRTDHHQGPINLAQFGTGQFQAVRAGGGVMDGFAELGASSGRAERLRMRHGLFTGPTSGLAPGNVQANLVILPKDLAHDFLRFAQANPRPCPVLGVTEVGRSAPADARCGPRSAHRSAALSRLAKRRNGRGADRHQRISGATIWWASPSAARSRSRRR